VAEVIEEGRLFTFDELRILLFGCGIDKIEGVYMPEKELTEEEVLLVLHHMAEKGMIKAGEKDFTIQGEIREMLQIMGHPRTAFIWSPDEDKISGDEYYCYVSLDKAVVSEQYWKKKETVKLRIFSLEEFEEWREEMRNNYDHY